jgi:hypothetical protein
MPSRIGSRLRAFVNSDGLEHEGAVIVVSYLFILAGAWNDALLGLAPSLWSHITELAMAAILAAEIASRVAFTEDRTRGYYAILLLDVISLLTIFPFFVGAGFARLARMFYAIWRLLRTLDKLASDNKNPLYLTVLFPFGVPLLAAVVYALERHIPSSGIHNYFEALLVCFAFALSLGNVRPASPVGMAICGSLFLAGLFCIGIITNWVSNRYQEPGPAAPARKR